MTKRKPLPPAHEALAATLARIAKRLGGANASKTTDAVSASGQNQPEDAVTINR